MPLNYKTEPGNKKAHSEPNLSANLHILQLRVLDKFFLLSKPLPLHLQNGNKHRGLARIRGPPPRQQGAIVRPCCKP